MKIRHSKSIIEITMECGNIVIIDREDLIHFAKHSWYVMQGHGQSKYLKTNISIKGKHTTIEFHRYILGSKKGLEIDHFNGNGLDNRRSNLRFVTHQQNQSNLPKRKDKKYTSQYYGVSYCKRDSNWNCFVVFNGKSKNLGRYKTEIESALAYNNFCILNKIPKRLNEL